jgi:hypothetical protein
MKIANGYGAEISRSLLLVKPLLQSFSEKSSLWRAEMDPKIRTSE